MSSLNNFVYDTVSFDVTAETGTASPLGLTFKPDGAKMYISDNDETIYQYSLSAPWDLSTVSYDSKSFAATSEGGNIAKSSLFFKPDGTKMYLLDLTAVDLDAVYQYTLSTPWDVSTASYDSKTFSTASETSSNSEGLFFKPDGTKMYVVSGNDSVYQYSLSSAWDISTASYDSKEANVSSQDNVPQGVYFNADGSKMYVAGAENDAVYQYTLSTPWDVSTASYDSVSLDVSSEEPVPEDIAFNSSYTRIYIVGSGNDKVYQYSLRSAIQGISTIQGIQSITF